MKFGRYLEDTQIPEWKKAYIDYGGLKKRIGAIKNDIDSTKKAFSPKRRFTTNQSKSSSLSGPSPGRSGFGVRFRTQTQGSHAPTSVKLGKGTTVSGISPIEPNVENSAAWSTSREGGMYGSFGRTPPSGQHRNEVPGSPPDLTLPPPIKSISDLRIHEIPPSPDNDSDADKQGPMSESPDKIQTQKGTMETSPQPPTNQSIRIEDSPVTPRRPKMLTTFSRKRANSAAASTRGPVTLVDVLAELPPLQFQFFEALDRELMKVQSFYRERGREAIHRSAVIKEQLDELKDHRKIFHAFEDQQMFPTIPKAIGKLAAHLSPPTMPWTHGHDEDDPPLTLAPSTSRHGARTEVSPQGRFDPEEYQNAKKKLKKAVLEFYRGIEYLQNYRILNLTGFRKALKKFDKITQRQTSQLYHNEKIEPSILSHPDTIDKIASEIESLYAARFEGGDRKKARDRLRASYQPKNHHFSTFRTGLLVGLSIPPIVAGIYQAYQPHTQQRIPAWSSLLQIYLGFFIPVAFGLLVSLNIIVWAHVRINYIFIFELDVRTVVDSREYAELPAVLLLTLSYVFWFSFSGLDSRISPTSWPLIWTIFALLVLLNPLPIFYPYSRRWIIRNSAALFISGTRRVEFPDFFLGDQYCSMVYTLTNFYWMGCLYQSHWRIPWGKCEIPIWAVPWLLATLPSWIRMVQCLRRYADSSQFLQLINAGKYTSSIIYYALYYNWRNRGSPRGDSFIPYILFGCIMSIYTTAWDILMDWSLFQRNARYPFLRKELIYTNRIPAYYIAIITNIIIRFGWIIYLPIPGPSPNVRGGILAIAEAFRRFQWNFFRLENEHLGNADQYRVTRDIPLPYRVDPGEISDDNGDEDDPVSSKNSQRSPLRLATLKRSPRTPRP